MIKALIGDVGRYAAHDGPGLRSTVFFKGCPLHCPWCHNPEFIDFRPEIAFYKNRCIACGDCVAACPEHAISIDNSARIDRDLCTGCGLCVIACPTAALKLVGKLYGLGELMELLLRDRFFYETSGGGVTLSGGEPTAQMEFCGLVLRQLKKEKIHTAIETNGLFDWDEFKLKCLDFLDLILIDIKLADPREHRRVTGKQNLLILHNLKQLIKHKGKDVVARVPVIPGYTDSQKNIVGIADLLMKAGVKRYSFLPYHPYGISKAEQVGKKQTCLVAPNAPQVQDLKELHKFFVSMQFVKF